VSKTVETNKKNTSRSLSKKFTFFKKVYWDKKDIWGKGNKRRVDSQIHSIPRRRSTVWVEF